MLRSLRGLPKETSAYAPLAGAFPDRRHVERTMNNIIWIVGAIVIVIAILSFLGLR